MRKNPDLRDGRRDAHERDDRRGGPRAARRDDAVGATRGAHAARDLSDGGAREPAAARRGRRRHRSRRCCASSARSASRAIPTSSGRCAKRCRRAPRGSPRSTGPRAATQDDEVVLRSQQAFTRALDATFASSSLEQRPRRRRRAAERPQAPAVVRGRAVQPARGVVPVHAAALPALGLRDGRRGARTAHARQPRALAPRRAVPVRLPPLPARHDRRRHGSRPSRERSSSSSPIRGCLPPSNRRATC